MTSSTAGSSRPNPSLKVSLTDESELPASSRHVRTHHTLPLRPRLSSGTDVIKKVCSRVNVGGLHYCSGWPVDATTTSI